MVIMFVLNAFNTSFLIYFVSLDTTNFLALNHSSCRTHLKLRFLLFCHYLPIYLMATTVFVELRKNAFTTQVKLVILRFLEFKSYLMQISNFDQLMNEEETNKEKEFLSEQSKRKAMIQQRITAYLNTSSTEV